MNPEHVRCTWCGGTGQTEPTVLDRLDLAEQGRMDLQCLLCDGTGRLPWPVTHMWCGRCRIVSDDTTQRTPLTTKQEGVRQTPKGYQ